MDMDSELENLYLDKEKYTDKQIEELRDKEYWSYIGKLNDFRHLFEKKINDVKFEVIFEKLMDKYLHLRILDMANTKRRFFKSWDTHLDKDGNIKSQFKTEKYKDSLTHKDDELVSDEEESGN